MNAEIQKLRVIKLLLPIELFTDNLTNRTPGHPESNDTPGIEVTTGPLGQGNAVVT